MKARILSVAAIAGVLVPFTVWPAHATEPGLSINDVTVQEPRFGTATATFTVSLDQASDDAVTVHYETSDPGDQIQAAIGSLTIPSGATAATIPVTVNYSLSTSDFNFTVALSEPVGASVADASGAGTVTNITPTGTFGCKATERVGGAGGGISAGSLDACIDDGAYGGADGATRVSTANSPWYYTSPQASANVTFRHESTYFPGISLGPVYAPVYVWVTVGEGQSGVKESCNGDRNAHGYVGEVTVFAGTNAPVPLVSQGARLVDYKSFDLGQGWRLEVNLTEQSGSEPVKSTRRTAVRLTAPNGVTSDLGIAEVRPNGNPCFS